MAPSNAPVFAILNSEQKTNHRWLMSSLFPQIAPGERLIGIAKLAAQGEAVDEGHNVEYITLENRSVLTRCNSPRMPFT